MSGGGGGVGSLAPRWRPKCCVYVPQVLRLHCPARRGLRPRNSPGRKRLAVQSAPNTKHTREHADLLLAGTQNIWRGSAWIRGLVNKPVNKPVNKRFSTVWCVHHPRCLLACARPIELAGNS